MRGTLAGETLAEQKLAAFEQLQPKFEASFRFVQEVHGQRRFAAFPVAETISYLHALWVCERKDRLLSVDKNIVRYDGQYCLNLLQHWQAGETAAVVAFLQRKLDGLPFADLMHQIEEAKTVRHAGDGPLKLNVVNFVGGPNRPNPVHLQQSSFHGDIGIKSTSASGDDISGKWGISRQVVFFAELLSVCLHTSIGSRNKVGMRLPCYGGCISRKRITLLDCDFTPVAIEQLRIGWPNIRASRGTGVIASCAGTTMKVLWPCESLPNQTRTDDLVALIEDEATVGLIGEECLSNHIDDQGKHHTTDEYKYKQLFERIPGLQSNFAQFFAKPSKVSSSQSLFKFFILLRMDHHMDCIFL